jgi:hypothetical protein
MLSYAENPTPAQRRYIAAKVANDELDYPIRMRERARNGERVLELAGASGSLFWVHANGAAFESSEKYE